jgi:hypothetical protein
MINSEKIAKWLASQLDKLKLSNPLLFVVVQAILVVFVGLLENQTIVIPTPEFIGKILTIFGIESINGFIMGVLVIVIALQGTRTAKFMKK